MTTKSKQGNTIENLEHVILDQVPAFIFAMDSDFNLILVNNAGCKWLGKDWKDIQGMKCYELFQTPLCQTFDCPIRQAMETGEVRRGQTEKKRDGKVIDFEFTSSPLRDNQGNIVGGVEYIVDITERLEAEAKAHQLQEDILELSTPVLSLWKDVLAIPLIGTLDSRRTQDAMEKALTRMAEEKAKVLIVDITGVPVVDTMVANHLIRMANAVQLMGGKSILTGISPATAKTIVHLGIDLSGLNTRATLVQGLELAIEFVSKGRRIL